jgi:hypothetical protein
VNTISHLKNVLQRPAGRLLAELTGFEVRKWHNVELAEIRTRSADLVGESADGSLLHVELQSTNDAEMALRMLEYAAAIRRRFGRFPAQLVLYVGMGKMRMKTTIQEASVHFRYRLVDVRELDGERLLASACLEDNLISILANVADGSLTLRRVLERIAVSDPARRERALAELAVLAGLRKLGTIMDREVSSMPILDDIWDHDLIGPERVRGERMLLYCQMETLFGPLDEQTTERIERMDRAAVEDLGRRLLNARSLQDLLG